MEKPVILLALNDTRRAQARLKKKKKTSFLRVFVLVKHMCFHFFLLL